MTVKETQWLPVHNYSLFFFQEIWKTNMSEAGRYPSDKSSGGLLKQYRREKLCSLPWIKL